MEEIANEAGVSFATIYKYFGSKENLLLSFADYWMRLLNERLIDHLQGLDSTKEKLRKAFWIQLDFYESNQEIGKIVFLTVPLGIWIAHGSYEQRSLIRLLLGVIKEGQQRGALNQHVSAPYLMDLIFGLIRRSFSMWIYRGQQYSLSDETNNLFKLLWTGLSNPDRKQSQPSGP
jgi:AcrR family transcriptional regulator